MFEPDTNPPLGKDFSDFLQYYITQKSPDQTTRELVEVANLNPGLKGVSSPWKTMGFVNKSNR